MATTTSARVRRAAGLRLLAVLALFNLALAAGAPPLRAQEATQAPPPRVQELLELLGDPDVQVWLAQQQEAAAAGAAEAATENATVDVAAPDYLSMRLAAIRGHLAGLVMAAPVLPQALSEAIGTLRGELARHGAGDVLLLLAAFLVLGLAAQRFYRRIARAAPAWVAALPLVSVPRRSACGWPMAAAWRWPLPWVASPPFWCCHGRRCCARSRSVISAPW